MHPIDQALNEVRSLHEQLTRTPAPDVGPQGFIPFPAGQDPVAFAIDEVARLKQLVESGIGADTPKAPTVPSWMPSASVFADETRIAFHLEIPGVSKEDLSVTVQANELVVSGRRQPQPRQDGLRPLVVEQCWGSFERRFPLPVWADAEKVSARYERGILEICLERGEDTDPGGFRVEIG